MSKDRSSGMSFADLSIAQSRRANEPLDRLNDLVKWYRFEKLVSRVRHSEGPGRPGYSPLTMFKALLLASLYGLSDAELEEALCDRLSFRRFLGLSLDDAIPDHTTLCRFRNALITSGLHERLFAEMDRQLDKAGLVLKRGTMLDATLIETAAARPPSGDKPAVDPEAGFAKRQGKAGSTYGYKAHVGVDEGSGIIRSVIATPANVNDTVPADGLIRGDEADVLGDAAYHTHTRQGVLETRGQRCLLMRRANKHHPLSPEEKRLNRAISRRRWAVETTFATWKRRMGFDAIRYIGLDKARAQIVMAAIAFNMRRWCAMAP